MELVQRWEEERLLKSSSPQRHAAAPASRLHAIKHNAQRRTTSCWESALLHLLLPAVVIILGGLSLVWVVTGAHVRLPGVSSNTELRVSVSNAYVRRQGASGVDYPWLQDEGILLVEPHRESTFTVTAAGRDDRAAVQADLPLSWMLSDVDAPSSNWHPARLWNGTNRIVATFEGVGDYHLRVRQSGGTTASVRCLCRYVRRELRVLSAHDRELFFQSVNEMQSLTDAQGKARYGSSFRSMDYFVQKHLGLAAGDRDSDRIDDGLGAFTNHVALSLEFEQALQILDATIALPFWDFTFDAATVATVHDGKWTHLFDAQVWGPDWFGNVATLTNTSGPVTTDRWAWTRVTQLDDGERPSTPSSPFGFLRAPWNVNPSPLVTRGTTLCGASALDLLAFPTCAVHRTLVDGSTDSYHEWAWRSLGAPQAPVRAVVAGTHNCDEAYAALAERLGADVARALQGRSTRGLRDAWRRGVVECPQWCASDAPASSCTCWCPLLDDIAANASALDVLLLGLDLDFVPHVDELDAASGVALVRALCDTGEYTGDLLDAGAPVDVTFWPIHPTIERLFQWKKLLNDFSTGATWDNPNGVTKYCALGSCAGHHEDDLLPMPVRVRRSAAEAVELRQLTNSEWLDLTNPRRSLAPYVYENFQWEHCHAVGVDMRQR